MSSSFVKFDEERLKKYKKAGYRIVGKNKHTGVEICRWTKSALRNKRRCYKQIYGVYAEYCLQCSPSLDFCNFSCEWCWRSFGKDRFKSEGKWDRPEILIDEMIKAQKNLISGFGGNEKTNRSVWEKANDPAHVAISLDGEPCLYPYLPELVKQLKERKKTVFIVSNGTLPQMIKRLIDENAEPTNIYISVYATNEGDYKKFTHSFIPKPLERVKESLRLFKKFKEARTVFRMTLVKDLNLKDAKGYSELIKISQPHFVELKGYSHLGESKFRLKRENMPSLNELEDFAKQIAKESGYIIKARDKVSRVIILVKDDETWEWSLKKIEEQNMMLGRIDDLNYLKCEGVIDF